MCGTGHQRPWPPLCMVYGGGTQKGLGNQYTSNFDQIKRVHINRPFLEFKNIRKPKSKRKKGSRSAGLLFASLLCYNFGLQISHSSFSLAMFDRLILANENG